MAPPRGVSTAGVRAERRTRSPTCNVTNDFVKPRTSAVDAIDIDPRLVVDVTREFHRRMAAIIDAVQTGVWEQGVHDLVGYGTDYDLGQRRGFQTLVLKVHRRSAYVRLGWNTIMGDGDADRQRVNDAVRSAISELG